MPTNDLPSAQLKSVPLSRIDLADDTYRITTRANVDDLQASISREGVLNPPFVIEKTTGFAIISGFRRISACKKLDFETITVRVLEPDQSALVYLRLAIADNAFQRPLDLIETSRSLDKLSRHLGTGRRLVESASSLGLPTNPAVLKKTRDLCLLPDVIQAALRKGTISLSMATDLQQLAPDCAVAFGHLFNEFKLSLNKQREMMSLVKEIARRDNTSEQRVLEDRRLQEIVSDQDLDRGHKARQLRDYLRRLRFPHLVEAENRFKSQLKQLRLGNDIKIIPPKDFEGPTYTLSMSFGSLAHLKALYAKIGRLIKDPVLKKIIER